MTCAPRGAARSRPRVRLTWRTSKPPEPRPSSRPWTLTTTSSPSATAPVRAGKATHASPSTSQRTRPSCSSAIAVTVPRRRLSAIARDLHERERDVNHPLEVRDGDPLVGRVDVRHPVREVEALQAALIEDVRIGAAAAEPVGRLKARPLQRGRGETHRLIVPLEAIASGSPTDRRLDATDHDPGREPDRPQHLRHPLPEP